LRARAKQLRVEIEPAAAQLIVDRVEGNLLAAKQELEKLSLLADGQSISADLVLRSVGDSARYDVFQLAEAAAAGDAARALRVLLGLKSEGVEPTLILWALVREVRGLWQARERNRLRSTDRGSGWNRRPPPRRARCPGSGHCRWRASSGRPAIRIGSSRGWRRATRGARSPDSPAASRALCKQPRIQAG
jgi:DNA polymerase-3 subunit delta